MPEGMKKASPGTDLPLRENVRQRSLRYVAEVLLPRDGPIEPDGRFGSLSAIDLVPHLRLAVSPVPVAGRIVPRMHLHRKRLAGVDIFLIMYRHETRISPLSERRQSYTPAETESIRIRPPQPQTTTFHFDRDNQKDRYPGEYGRPRCISSKTTGGARSSLSGLSLRCDCGCSHAVGDNRTPLRSQATPTDLPRHLFEERPHINKTHATKPDTPRSPASAFLLPSGPHPLLPPVHDAG